MNYKDTIFKIKSIRDYKSETINKSTLEELKGYFQKARRLINLDTQILIMDKENVYNALKNSAGYNDFMIEAPHYMVVLSEENPYYLENTGYLTQDILLKAFELGIGSCWITMKDSEDVKRKLNINSDKKLTALIALGYAEEKSKVLYKNVSDYNPSKAEVEIIKDNTADRLATKNIVYKDTWGNNADVDELINLGIFDGLYYARMAPSSKNRQPWRFIVDNGLVVLAMRKDEFSTEYEEKIESGIVMLYFATIISSTMFEINWNLTSPQKDYKIPNEYKIVAYCIS